MAGCCNCGTPHAMSVWRAAHHTMHVAERWKRQATKDGRWVDSVGNYTADERKAIHHQLVALGSYPDPEAVARIIGNPSWSHGTCMCCEQYILVGVQLDDSATHLLCERCIGFAERALTKALAVGSKMVLQRRDEDLNTRGAGPTNPTTHGSEPDHA